MDKGELRCDQDQYAMLLRCAEKGDAVEWNEWREANLGIEVWLQGAKLKGARLPEVHLHMAHLDHANFLNADLRGASFVCSTLTDVIFCDAHVENSKLEAARLDDANLTGAFFDNSDLEAVHCTRTRLVRVSFQGACLLAAKIRSCEVHTAVFDNADLTRVELRDSGLWKASLRHSTMSAAVIEDSHLDKVDLTGANLLEAELSNVVLVGATLKGTDFTSTMCRNVDFRDAIFGATDSAASASPPGSQYTKFDRTLMGSSLLSISKETDPRAAIRALSHAEVNGIRFLDPLFGRSVRDEAWLFYFRKKCRRTLSGRIVQFLWWVSSDYGRSVLRWVTISALMALLFGSIFSAADEQFVFPKLPKGSPSSFAPFYYSIVTFTTLGFGDITPRIDCWWAQAIVTVEVIVGYVMLGGLISLFANKLARRND